MTNLCLSQTPIWLHALAAASLLFAASPNMALLAQGLEGQRTAETIIGSEIETAEEHAAAESERIIAAIENTAGNTSEVRKTFSLDNFEIVFLLDLGEGATAIQAAIEDHMKEIRTLRGAIEGSAMFFHAVDSRSVPLREIVAVEFDDADGVTIFVDGSKPIQ